MKAALIGGRIFTPDAEGNRSLVGVVLRCWSCHGIVAKVYLGVPSWSPLVTHPILTRDARGGPNRGPKLIDPGDDDAHQCSRCKLRQTIPDIDFVELQRSVPPGMPFRPRRRP